MRQNNICYGPAVRRKFSRMALTAVREFFRGWSPRALLTKFDKRRLQQEIDTHRLFLLTSFAKESRGPDLSAIVSRIQTRAAELPFGEQRKEVEANVQHQLLRLLQAIQNAAGVEEVVEEKQAAPAGRRSGLQLAVGAPFKPPPKPPVESTLLSTEQVSDRLHSSTGFTLHLHLSTVPHIEAGEGLFLRGEVDVGQVVALYPGVCYPPSHHSCIPGYPRVDRLNPYLVSRFDGVVLDGKAWGRGGERREWWSGLSREDYLWYDHLHAREGEARMKEVDEVVIRAARRRIERRNPLALAHFANHPGAGMEPNVMLCPYDMHVNHVTLRPFYPNVRYAGTVKEIQREKVLSGRNHGSKVHTIEDREEGVDVIQGLAFVATKQIRDEEVLLNYRLSTPMGRPDWYTPVNEEEDKRRWA